MAATTIDRALSILQIFSVDRPEWTVEEIASTLSLSGSTAYEYVRSLVGAGLLVSARAGRYTIGPAIIELDRITRRFDPLVQASGPMLRELTDSVEPAAIGLLCRLYRLTVICVDQLHHRLPDLAISYERGRPMPLIRGSASRVILANLSSRPLRRVYDADPRSIAAAGLGDDWTAFKQTMRTIRRPGVMRSYGELDPGVIGISAPVFDSNNEVLGSIGIVLRASDAQHDIDQLSAAVRDAGEQVTRILQG